MATRTTKPKAKTAARAKAAARSPARATKDDRDFVARATEALRRREPDAISDTLLQQVFAAAVKIYAAKIERHGGDMKPFRDGAVTATESVVAACALIRAADLNLFDVAMWFNRPPAVT
jgi:hypothetical protein